MQPTSLIPRHAQTAVTAALSDTRVVVINGARQTGKSTLARLVMADFPGSELRFLDEAPVRAAALADPALFVRHSGLLVIDEVQRAPDLLRRQPDPMVRFHRLEHVRDQLFDFRRDALNFGALLPEDRVAVFNDFKDHE